MNANITKVIVPCAGFGKRVGAPKAKEMLVLDGEDAPLIKWGLDLIVKSQFAPVIVARSTKKELLIYLENLTAQIPIEIELIESSREWPDTILKSENSWSEKNIVLLPDTRFAPKNILELMDKELENHDLVFSTFDCKNQNFSSWGVIDYFDTNFFIAEKPTQSPKGRAKAWGLFGFRKNFGVELLNQMLTSNSDHLWKSIKTKSIAQIELSNFEDVTRDYLKLSEYNF